tara:strand:+ start:908 stop:1336 length:429 start_codon:yes stop_codon:yes gene_type:complete
MKISQILWGLFIFVIGSFILTAIISPESLDNFSSYIDKINIGGNSNLDIVQNPQDYIGKRLILKNIDICVDGRIIDFKPDGNEVYLDYNYLNTLNSHYRFDFIGTVALLNESGKIKYFFYVNEAIQKEYVRDYEGGSWFNCN